MFAHPPAPPAQTIQSSAAHLPSLTAKALDGTVVKLPDGLPGERTLLLIAFERDQQADLDTWSAGLKLSDGNIPWLELPVIQNPGTPVRWFINNGMRRGIEERTLWPHVVSLYTNKTDFKEALHLTSETSVYAALADSEGHLLAIVPGRYTQAGSDTLRRALTAR